MTSCGVRPCRSVNRVIFLAKTSTPSQNKAAEVTQKATAGNSVERVHAQIVHANESTYATNVSKNMPQPHALEVGSKQNLPSPVQVDRLAIYLRGYDTTEKSFLLDRFTSGFRLGSSYPIKARLICKNHRSAVEKPRHCRKNKKSTTCGCKQLVCICI